MAKDKFMVGDRVRIIDHPSKMSRANKEGVVSSGTLFASDNPPDYHVKFGREDLSVMLESDLILIHRPTADDLIPQLGGA